MLALKGKFIILASPFIIYHLLSLPQFFFHTANYQTTRPILKVILFTSQQGQLHPINFQSLSLSNHHIQVTTSAHYYLFLAPIHPYQISQVFVSV